MIDDRLRRARIVSLELFEEERAVGTPYERAAERALDAHFEATRRFSASIDREMDEFQDLLEARYPPPRRLPRRRGGIPGKHVSRVSVASTTAAEAAVAIPAKPIPPEPHLVAEPSVSSQAAPTISEPAEKAQRFVPAAERVPINQRATMTTKIDEARKETIAGFERMLSRGLPRGQAIDEALDAHYDRIESVCRDLDAELAAMDAILRQHQPPARPVPQTARSTSNRGGAPRPSPDDALLTSPFRFVELNDRVVEADMKSLQDYGLDRPRPDGLCGTITVTWVAETPILIGEEHAEGAKEIVGPMKMGVGPKAPYVIPGATLRGCLRAALEIVASGRLAQINGHARFGLRDFDHPHIRPPGDENASRLAKDKVRAGWLCDTGNKTPEGKPIYEIRPCREWKTIAIADLPFLRHGKGEYEWRADWLKLALPERYRHLSAEYKNIKNKPLKPFVDETRIRFADMEPLSFRLTERPDAVGELVYDPDGGIKGRLVFSNRSPAAPSAAVIESLERQRKPGQPKKREYVFIDDRSLDTIDVVKEVWDRFELINSRVFKNERRADGSWADLEPSLKDGGRIPVFFIGDEKDPKSFQFGLTRFFKVAHTHAVADMRDRIIAHRRTKVSKDNPASIDFVEALFGHVLERDEALKEPDVRTPANALARKGRVAFGFATAEADAAQEDKYPIDTVMAAPRASFAPFYLKGPVKDWSASERDGTTLAGRKRYIPRFPSGKLNQARAEIDKALKNQIERLIRDGGRGPDEKMKCHLRFLKPTNPNAGIPFTGKIRLHNLSKVELGALLWVLTHGGDPNKPCRHMMGRAKPFGAGQIRISALALDLEPNRSENIPKEKLKDWELLKSPNTPQETGWLAERSAETSWSMVPFLKAFHDYMAEHRPKWPRTRDLVEFLASSRPDVGARLLGRMAYPEMKAFAEIRKGGKLSTRFAPPDDRRTRYLPALADGEAERWALALRLPYQEDAKT